MKKIKILLLALLTICLFSFSTITAFAEEPTSEGEIATESEVLSESEEILESAVESAVEPKIELTESELKDIVNSVLTDNQKNTVTSVSEVLANYFKLSPEKIYIIVAVALILLLTAFYFVGKYVTKSGKVKSLSEQVKALASMVDVADKDKAKYKELVEVLSKDGIEGVIDKACAKLEDSLLKNLKLDSETISALLLKADINTAYAEKIVEAFKILAQDAGKTAMLNELSSCPETSVVARLELENAKMKNALGEDAVAKILL